MTKVLAGLPSVDEIMRGDVGQICVARFGHSTTLAQVRAALASLRERLAAAPAAAPARGELVRILGSEVLDALESLDAVRMRRVFNLTGTILHTNLGRAIYAEAAVAAATTAMRHPLALEYDLEAGRRGQRDEAVQDLIAEITGAEAACIVNNNAAAVFLVLAALGRDRETIVSRGELIEIGGSFRMPDIMASAGTRLREVGTTNRTHQKDYRTAIGPETGLLMKVHTSNYLVQGFTKEVTAAELAAISREAGLPFVHDLGSGVLVDLSRWGLAREPTVQDALADGADLVTFSGDKLLGGPQAGFIAGRRDLVRLCASHPIKRATRLDKVRLAALEATLKLYRAPEKLAETLPTLHYLARGTEQLTAMAQRLRPAVASALGGRYEVEVAETKCQIGSGALPLETIPSVAIRIPAAGGDAERIAAAFRRLPIPIIGRLERGAVLFDMRCLDHADDFVAQLVHLAFPQ